VTKLGFVSETLAESYVFSLALWFSLTVLSNYTLFLSYPPRFFINFSLALTLHTGAMNVIKTHFVSTYFLIGLLPQFKVMVFWSRAHSCSVFQQHEQT